MAKTNEPKNRRDVDASNKSEQSRVTTQLATELMKCTQTFFCLFKKFLIAFKMAEAHGIIYMKNRYLSFVELFAQ